MAYSEALKYDSYLHSLRGALHAALHYQMIGQSDLKRNQGGIWTWLLWALTKSTCSAPRDLGGFVRSDSSDTYDFFALEMRDAHWGSLFPIARDLQSAGQNIRIWIPDKTVCTGLEGLKNVEHRTLEECIYRRRTPFLLIVRILRHISPVLRLLNLHWDNPNAGRLAQVIWDFETSKSVWEGLTRVLPSRACFLTSEGSATHKGMVQAYRASGARVFHVCHGLPWEYHANSNATDIIPFSTADAKWFRKRVATETTVHECGNPRMSQIHEDFTFRRQPFTSGFPIRVLYLSNGVEDCYTREHEAQDLSILKLSDQLSKYITLRVRPHPRENREQLQKALSKSGLTIDAVTDGSLVDDLEWADICATPWSTSLIEAYVCGRACVWTNARNDRMCGTGDYIDAGIGKVAADSMSWELIIKDFIKNMAQTAAALPTDDKLVGFGLIKRSGTQWMDLLKLNSAQKHFQK